MNEFAAGPVPKTDDDEAQPGSAMIEPTGTTSIEGPSTESALAQSVTATPAINQNIIINQRRHGPGLFVRAVWYLFVGWWLTALAIGFAWVCALSVVLLPLAYLIVNKVPVVLTLRPRSVETDVTVDADGTIRITTGGAQQHPFWMRAVWFVLVGWWACGAAMIVAYLLALTIILLPFGLMLFNRIPAVMTLQRN